MSDYQQIPGNIRSLLATKSQTWSDHAADLAAHYAQLCDDTNQRLRRCAEYLRRGMTSAAVHLADCQPNLVQAVKALQFPERSVWADLCVNHGMQAPAVLETDCLDPLKGAYSREKALQPLMSRHRLLALARAPVRVRLDVSRMLATEDADNPSWPDEIRGLESIRLREIEAESLTALRDHNEPAIEAIWNELSGQRWRQEIPRSLHGALEKAIANQKAKRALGELPALAAELLAAFSADPPADDFADLARKWKEKVATPGISVPADLAAQVQPALDWEAASQRRKFDLQEVKPLQHLFESPEPPKPAQAGQRFWFAILLASIFGIGAAIAYVALHYLRK